MLYCVDLGGRRLIKKKSKGSIKLQLNGVQIMCSSELEEPLTYFLQSDLAAKGIEVRRRSDFDDVLTANILAQDANEIPDDMELTAYFAIGIEISDIISQILSLIHISEPTRRLRGSRMPSSA